MTRIRTSGGIAPWTSKHLAEVVVGLVLPKLWLASFPHSVHDKD